MASDAGSAACSCLSWICDCIKALMPYMCDHETHVIRLTLEMNSLGAMWTPKKEDVERFTNQGVSCSSTAVTWVNDVESLNGRVQKIKQDSENRIKCAGSCPINCCSTYWLSRQAVNMLPLVNDLKVRGESIHGVLDERQHPNFVTGGGSSSAVAAAVDVEEHTLTPARALSKVRECLTSSEVTGIRIIGIQGMGGVGKTELLQRIYNESGGLDFDPIISVVVPKDEPKDETTEAIQKAIGNRINLLWSEDQDERRNRISKLLRLNKFLILLDDIWEPLDLEAVGIPHLNGKNGSTVVFATQSSTMKADTIIKLQCMEWDEAWNLFCDTVGNATIKAHPKIEKLAETVVELCERLPLTLSVVGTAMIGQDTPEQWSRAIQLLQNSPFEITNMEDKVISKLMLSYKKLSDDANNPIRQCFRYCSLFPPQYPISKVQLIEYWIGEGFLETSDEQDDIDDVYLEGHSIIGDIKKRFHLKSGDKETEIKMHDAIRMLALWIASEKDKTNEDKFLVMAGKSIRAPRIGSWQDANRISIMQTSIKELTGAPNCPKLLTLILQQNPMLKTISKEFFQSMPLLRVLDLSYTCIKVLMLCSNDSIETQPLLPHLRLLDLSNTCIEELPKEIDVLVNLRHLNLSGTKITTLPEVIAKLSELQFLNLSYTNLETLPTMLASLVKLKHLNLGSTSKLSIIPPEVISGLSMLQVLNLYNSNYAQWEVGMEELDQLNCLRALGITISNSRALQKLLGSHMLSECVRDLQIVFCEDVGSIQLSSVFKNMRILQVSNCLGLKDLIISSEQDAEKWLLSSLQSLTLDHLPELSSIQAVSLESDTFLWNLGRIEISYCRKLKNVTWIAQLPNLQELKLFSCNELKEVIGGEVAASTVEKAFSTVRTLDLQELSKLQRIWTRAFVIRSLENMVVSRCPELKKLGLLLPSPKNNTLPNIWGDQDWWNALDWGDDAIKTEFEPCFKVKSL